MAGLNFEDLIPAAAPNKGSVSFDDLVPQGTGNANTDIARLIKGEPPTQSTWGDTAKDVAASVGSGLARGTADLVGLPGTLSNAFNNGMSYITGLPRLPQSPVSGETVRGAASVVSGGATDYAPKTTPGKYAATASEFVPGALAFGGLNAGSAARYGVIPGLASEGAGQATEGTAFEPYARVAGALLAPAGTALAERAITPFPTSAARQAASDVMAREGVDLTAGQRTGSNALRYAESELGGNAAGNFMERQGEQFTTAALRRAGETGNRATPEVIDNAFRRVGGDFNDLAQRNTLLPDAQMGQDVGNVLRDYISTTPESMRAPIIQDIVGDIATRSSQGPISGEWYQSLSSNLAKRARETTNPELSNALQGIRGAVDDAMERSIATNNPADLGGWQQARQQYRNLLVLEKASTGAGENAALGLISPSALRNAVVTQSRRAYARGQGDFGELARAGEATMKPLPNSGTASRLNARNLGTRISSLLGAGAGSAAGGPYGAIVGALAGSALPAAAGRALLSAPVRAYLSNQILQPTSLADPRYAAVLQALLSGSKAGAGKLESPR